MNFYLSLLVFSLIITVIYGETYSNPAQSNYEVRKLKGGRNMMRKNMRGRNGSSREGRGMGGGSTRGGGMRGGRMGGGMGMRI
mmetsp:Transcript_38934/g.44435  ORF Transcript_38934/g.44435 Transcript_38934/m.44435 type:complete len:83 (+) Transcript_38934:127-375(+)